MTDLSYRTQRDASADAAEQPAILRAAPVIAAIMFDSTARVVVSPREPRAFAAALRQVERPGGGSTNVTAGLRAAVDLLAGMDCERRVADVSGDGRDNAGGNLAAEVERAASLGVEVNCLPIVTPQEPDVADWYRANVCNAGGFTIPGDWDGYARAIRAKMAIEVSAR